MQQIIKDLTYTPSPRGTAPNDEVDLAYVDDVAKAMDGDVAMRRTWIRVLTPMR